MRIESIEMTATATPVLSLEKVGRTHPVSTGSDLASDRRVHEAKFDEALVFPGRDRQRNVEDAVHTLDEAIKPLGFSIQFSRDEETKAMVIKVIDQASGEMVRQIPDEAMLHLSATLGKLQGQIFSCQA